MDTSNMSILLENSSVRGMNVSTSHFPAAIKPLNLFIACFVSVSFLVGTTVNGLFLWVLGVKMKRTINTLWFLHLILIHLISSSYMPFFVAYILLGSHWAFGKALCKVLNFSSSLGMFTTVFLLTIVSLDRYLLTCHPIWSQHNRTISRAQKLITGTWLVSFALSAPYLFFRETQETTEGKIQCVNNYALSNNWEAVEMQAFRNHIHLVFFVVRVLLAFVIPLFIIAGCYYSIGWKMKKKKLTRTGKPFKVLTAAVASFFICWFPYHLSQASLVFQASEQMVKFLQLMSIIGVCLNFCFTPVLYLFVGEKFQQVFKTSVLALLQKGFADASIIPEGNINPSEEVHHCVS
uniref:Probable G-protein coupled receptor 33 n=1 Tax=Pogona vitticeps TaxID=103695 RepID=A0A6J0UR18_9SAUR